MPILLSRRAPQPPAEETDPYATYEVGGVPVDPPDYERSGAHETAGIAAAATIERLDSGGSPSGSGSIGILGIGMSNARSIYEHIKPYHEADVLRQPGSVVVNAGDSGKTQESWRDPSNSCWSYAATKVTQAGLTAAQVQMAYVTMIQMYPNTYGNLTTDGMDEIFTNLMATYPNVKIVLLSPIGYTGFSRAPGKNNKVVPVDAMYADALFLADLVATAHDFPGAAWVDYYPTWANGSIEDPLTGLTYLAADINTDGFHLSDNITTPATGRRKVATNINNRLKADPVLTGVMYQAG